MKTCPSCNVSLLLQKPGRYCTQCGAELPVSSIVGVAQIETMVDIPDDDTARRQLAAALQHAAAFHRSEGRHMTWEFTPTGADCYLDGDFAFEAKIQHAAGMITDTIFVTRQMKCPACQGWLTGSQNVTDEVTPPSPDDATICGHCMTTLIFTEHGGLRLATQHDIDKRSDEEREELATALRQLRILKGSGVDTGHEGVIGNRLNITEVKRDD